MLNDRAEQKHPCIVCCTNSQKQPGGHCAVGNLAASRSDTFGHEICVFYGMLDISASGRLRHGE
jgi:hypothetical protein